MDINGQKLTKKLKQEWTKADENGQKQTKTEETESLAKFSQVQPSSDNFSHVQPIR